MCPNMPKYPFHAKASFLLMSLSEWIQHLTYILNNRKVKPKQRKAYLLQHTQYAHSDNTETKTKKQNVFVFLSRILLPLAGSKLMYDKITCSPPVSVSLSHTYIHTDS